MLFLDLHNTCVKRTSLLLWASLLETRRQQSHLLCGHLKTFLTTTEWEEAQIGKEGLGDCLHSETLGSMLSIAKEHTWRSSNAADLALYTFRGISLSITL